MSFAIHCLCFLRLVYSAALTLGPAHLAPWIQSSDVTADACKTKATEYLKSLKKKAFVTVCYYKAHLTRKEIVEKSFKVGTCVGALPFGH